MTWAIALLLCGYGMLSGYAWTARYMWGAREQSRDLLAQSIAYSSFGIALLVTGFFLDELFLPGGDGYPTRHMLAIAVGSLSSVMFTVWHVILGQQRFVIRIGAQ